MNQQAQERHVIRASGQKKNVGPLNYQSNKMRFETPGPQVEGLAANLSPRLLPNNQASHESQVRQKQSKTPLEFGNRPQLQDGHGSPKWRLQRPQENVYSTRGNDEYGQSLQTQMSKQPSFMRKNQVKPGVRMRNIGDLNTIQVVSSSERIDPLKKPSSKHRMGQKSQKRLRQQPQHENHSQERAQVHSKQKNFIKINNTINKPEMMKHYQDEDQIRRMRSIHSSKGSINSGHQRQETKTQRDEYFYGYQDVRTDLEQHKAAYIPQTARKTQVQ